jgi:hypothetical protein
MRRELPQSLPIAGALHRSTIYHSFYGNDKVPGKLEPNYGLAYSTCGIVDCLASLGEQAGEIIVHLEVSPWCAPRGMWPASQRAASQVLLLTNSIRLTFILFSLYSTSVSHMLTNGTARRIKQVFSCRPMWPQVWRF